MATVASVITTIVAAIKAIPIIDKWFQMLISAYLTSQTNETKAHIVDAAAFAARAKTDEERYEASQKWQDALSRTRYLP